MNISRYENNKLRDGFTITAHAGAMSLPDNSIEAIEQAIYAGADIVEMDVSLRPDGTPVIIHSEKPNQDEGILLDDAFSVVSESKTVKINLDLKRFDNIHEVQKLAEKHDLLNRIFFTGVDEKYAKSVQLQCPLIPSLLNVSIKLPFFKSSEYAQYLADKIISLNCIGLNCSYKGISSELVEIMHNNDLIVSVWTVNKEKDMLKMLSLSVDNITTRDILKLKDIVLKY